MKFGEVQPKVWDRLVRTWQRDRVGSAYLFAGPQGCGKEWAALEFARLLNCEAPGDEPCGTCPACIPFLSLQHPNLKLVYPLPTDSRNREQNGNPLSAISDAELKQLTDLIAAKGRDPFVKIQLPKAKRIRIDSIRELRKNIYLKQSGKGRKMVLLFDAHLLSEGQGESANALLKILEEPPESTTLILVTDYKTALLPTIISRCQPIYFPPLSDAVMAALCRERGIADDQITFVTSIARGNLHRALTLAELSSQDLFDQAESMVRQISNGKAEDWNSLIQTLSLLAAQKPVEFQLRIYLLQFWFHNAHLLHVDPNEVQLPELYERFKRFNAVFPQANFSGINLALETLLESMARNLYLPLTLINVLLSIQDCLKGQEPILLKL
jgi:DNA polymerase-3 subunit delta'